MDWQPLIEAACSARERAYAPYSGFAVGAALASADGRVFSGTNVENRSFGLSLCAERAAVAAAVAAGANPIVAIVVVTDSRPPAPPCGLCRETLAEFCPPDLPILLHAVDGESRETSLGELFPDPFRLPAGLRNP